MKLRALENPVRSARIVRYEGKTLTLEIESERGRYRWDVRPIYSYEIDRIKAMFSRSWRTALKSLISESLGIYPARLNPDFAAQWSKPWKKKVTRSYTRWTKLLGPYRLSIECFGYGAKLFTYVLDRKKGITRAPSGAWNSLRDAIEGLRLELQSKLNVPLPGLEKVRTLFNPQERWKML